MQNKKFSNYWQNYEFIVLKYPCKEVLPEGKIFAYNLK